MILLKLIFLIFFFFCFFCLVINVTAAAPSFIPEAFPAVTVPSFLKTGFNLDKASRLIPSLGCSSLLKSISAFFDFILKLIISSLNLFFFEL